MAQELLNQSISGVQSVDDLYFSALSNGSVSEKDDEVKEIFPISDANYAEELQFQEALMASVITSQMAGTGSTAAKPLIIADSPPANATEVGESSQCFCDICVEKKEPNEMFRIDSCAHSFCSDCISKHVTMKIQENMKVVSCPDWNCGGTLELDSCRPRMSAGLVEIWDRVLCESMIPDSQKYYCPFNDCSAMLVDDGDGREAIKESECPACHRLFCARCQVPFHVGIDCEDFQRLNEDERGRKDLMVRELAAKHSWMRCPHCKFYVEKIEGCLHMTCRCGLEFCYACGATWTQTHGGCQRP